MAKSSRLAKSIVVYGIAVAVGVFALEWLQYRYTIHAFATEIYIGLIAVAFLGLGIFVGARLFDRSSPVLVPGDSGDATTQRALGEVVGAPTGAVGAGAARFGISDRELEVLVLIAEGLTNNQIAEQLCVSPNTVKTHAANLFRKLDVARRTQAVQKARSLGVLT